MKNINVKEIIIKRILSDYKEYYIQLEGGLIGFEQSYKEHHDNYMLKPLNYFLDNYRHYLYKEELKAVLSA